MGRSLRAVEEVKDPRFPSPERYRAEDGVVYRVTGNNLLVLVDKIATTTAGGIVLPSELSGEDNLNTGVIVAVGFLTTEKADYHTPIPGVKQGDGCSFIKFQEKVDSNQYLAKVVGERLIRLRPSDILYIYDR